MNQPTPPTQQPTAAPTRVCPHCHTQSQAAGTRCPNCGKKYKKRGFFGKLVVAALVFVVLMALLVGGCAALIGGAANEVQKESDKKGITPAQFAAVRNGMTRARVEKALGEPSDAQEMDIDTSEFEGAGATQSNDCIYYNKKGKFADLYQLCFTNDKLTSKASY